MANKFYRYMSKTEFNKLVSGEYIADRKTWEGCRTSSRGVCFLNTTREDAYNAYDFLEGVVSEFALVEFVPKNADIRQSFGIYAGGWYGEQEVAECYILDGYSVAIMQPVKVMFAGDCGFWGCKWQNLKNVKYPGRKEWDI